MRGLIAETTVPAAISSPPSSTTPTARPFSTRIRAAGAPVRMVDAGLFGGGADRGHHRAHAAHRRKLAAGHAADFAGQAIVEAEQRGRRARTEMAAEHRVEGEQALEPVVGKLFVAEIGDIHQQHAQEVAHVLLAEPSQRQAVRASAEASAKSHAAKRRRTARKQRLQDAGIAEELRAHLRPGRCSGGSGAFEPLAIGAAQDQRLAVGRERDARNLAHRRKIQPVAFEVERLHHIRVQPVEQMRRRDAEARREFVGAAGAAGLGVRLRAPAPCARFWRGWRRRRGRCGRRR